MIAALEHSWIDACAGRGLATPRRVHVLKVGNVDYPHPVSPLVFLLFADRSARPTAAAKVARVAEGDLAIDREADWLATTRPQLAADVAMAVPELLVRGRINDRSYFLCTALAGSVEPHHTWGAAAARRANGRIAAALEWCERLAAAAPAAPIDAATWLGSLPDVLARLAQAGLDAAVAPVVAQRLSHCWSHAWPAGLAHGDFFPGNVLFGRGDRPGVVDWATASARAPVFVDPLAYELSFALQSLVDSGRIDANEHRAVHALAPFAASRQRLAQAGVDLVLGADARVLAAAAAVLREANAAIDRAAAARRWLRVLEFEARLSR